MTIIALTVLAIVFLAQLLIPKARFATKRNGLLLFVAASIAVFGNAVWLSVSQYHLWLSSGVGKFFLPPYQSFDYFVFYSRARFFDPYLLSFLLGILFLIGAAVLNRNYGELFFEPIEPYLFGTALLLGGTPGWFAYGAVLFTLFFLEVLSVTIYAVGIRKQAPPRVGLYYLWLPAGIFTIMISRWLSMLPWWQMLRF
ncbi:MAG: hypothetical protein KGJ13_13130 [Patescibacteria group bacterium]|nr:hypothetical protein [Patescibacteria group bacterium]